MKYPGFLALILVLLAAAIVPSPAAQPLSPFSIRGTLPWHNFLSGPTAWNFEDYRKYLDDMSDRGFNFVGFHCYTGGGGRYVSYVEPIIRVEYANVLPNAEFDTSATARWGYRPMATERFAFGSNKLFDHNLFGCDAAIRPHNNEQRYEEAQNLMRQVIRYAHSRGIKVGLGFEFGIYPPEFMSVVPPESVLRSPYLPDPTHPASIEIQQRYIENIVDAYPELDYLWLWLHEHSFMVGKFAFTDSFQKYYAEHKESFAGMKEESLTFNGVWALAYISQSYDYLHEIAPQTRMVISGWGGDNQFPALMEGLDAQLPKEIIFSCLNPWTPSGRQSEVFNRIDGRDIWVIPWLEGDNQLWHPQPRVAMLADSITTAEQQKTQGVIGIHWRTEDIRANFDAFNELIDEPLRPEDRKQLTKEEIADYTTDFYKRWCAKEYGPAAGKEIAASLAKIDLGRLLADMRSPEYYPYNPTWGRLPAQTEVEIQTLKEHIENVLQETKNEEHKNNLEYLEDTLEFVLLLDEVGRRLEPAYKLKDILIVGKPDEEIPTERITAALEAMDKAPLRELFEVYARRVRSRGELGVLSSLNQKLWQTAVELKQFLQDRK